MEKSAPLLLLALLVVAHRASAHAAPYDDDVFPAPLSAICAKTRNPNLCHHILHPYLPTSARLDSSWALAMHIKTLKKSTLHVIAVATAKSVTLRHDRTVSTALKGCLSGDYAGSLDSLDKAEKRLASRDVPGLKIELSAVLSGYSFCDDEFVDFDVAVSPVAQSNDKLSDLATLTLDLAQLIN